MTKYVRDFEESESDGFCHLLHMKKNLLAKVVCC